jgi:F-type H+-transporting ATPase subunit gamma
MSLKAIKNKIRSVNKTRKVTKAMEAVSAVKMRKNQERALAGRPYARAALSILSRVSGSAEAQSHDLVVPRVQVKRVALLVVSSDKGLCGGLNTALFKRAHQLIKERGWNKNDIALFAIGRKASEHFTARDFHLLASYPTPEASTTLADVDQIAERVIKAFRAGDFDEVHIVYTNFKSTFEQEPSARQLLPVSFASVAETVAGIVPDKGKYAEIAQDTGVAPVSYVVEPSPESVFDALIPSLVTIELYHAFLESAASEHSARMVAMKNASDKAGEVSRSLTLKFNKARQSIITREVSEIVGGMEVMK